MFQNYIRMSQTLHWSGAGSENSNVLANMEEVKAMDVTKVFPGIKNLNKTV